MHEYESNIINGTKMANDIIAEIKQEHDNYMGTNKSVPHVAIIQIGDREDSNIYIKKKQAACEKVGFVCLHYKYDSDILADIVYRLLYSLNGDDKINGIIVQLPVPENFSEEDLLGKISYVKDIEGLNAYNMGNLALDKRVPLYVPCTALACMEILKRENVLVKGKHVVVVGKSNLVGLPLLLLLLKEMATVTTCHIETTDIISHLQMADIVISACGKPLFIKKSWLKNGVTVLDVGINTIPNPDLKSNSTLTSKKKYKLVGDVDTEHVKTIAHKITPVPGGIGPMTVAMLLSNLLKSYKFQNGIV